MMVTKQEISKVEASLMVTEQKILIMGVSLTAVRLVVCFTLNDDDDDYDDDFLAIKS